MALVDTDFIKLIDEQKVFPYGDLLKAHVQPASLDLPLLANLVYLVTDKMVPFERTIEDLLMDIKITQIKDGLLLKNQTYLCYFGFIQLPSNIKAKCSPKSSIGRIDVLVRTIFDNHGFYDEIPTGGSGHLWVQVCPRSFNIQLEQNIALTQVMLFDEEVIPCPQKDIILHLDISNGYQALQTNEVLDLSLRNNIPSKFFEAIKTDGRTLLLEKNKFYILPTIEKITIPPTHSGELESFVHRLGLASVHFAGFFDSGFDAIGVLEICPYETMRVTQNQPIALLRHYVNKSIPNKLYGQANNNYQFQTGPKLAKFFGAPKKRSRQTKLNLKLELTKLIPNIEWQDAAQKDNYYFGIYLYKKLHKDDLEKPKNIKEIVDEIYSKEKRLKYQMYIEDKMLYFHDAASKL